jgi:hypothetical protein
LIRAWPALVVLATGCTQERVRYLPEPMPLALAPSGGALSATAAIALEPSPLPLVVDTGSPLTTFDDRSGSVHAAITSFALLDALDAVRLQIDNVRLFAGPLRAVGLGPAPFAVGAVLGGDNLGQFALGLDYRQAAPTLLLSSSITACSCELADACQAVLPFTLSGGQELLAVGDSVYALPATRVLVDVCLEPLVDPVNSPDPEYQRCAGTTGIQYPPYTSTGVETRLLVATGFPGFALGSGVYDRLRGSGAAQALVASSPAQLHLPDPDDDGPPPAGSTIGPGLTVGTTTIGGGGVAALAMVSREFYLGPCGELARSRRLRRTPPGRPRAGENACLDLQRSDMPKPDCVNLAPGMHSDACYDFDDKGGKDSPAAAVIELDTPIPTLVVDDNSPLLSGINSDVRPQGASVEGVIGTEVLRRLVTTIDYPAARLIARCADTNGCLAYRRYAYSNAPAPASDCLDSGHFCVPPLNIPPNGGGLCPPAP